MFGIKRKIKIADAGALAPVPAKKLIMSDILPARGHLAAPLISDNIAARSGGVSMKTGAVQKTTSAPAEVIDKKVSMDRSPVVDGRVSPVFGVDGKRVARPTGRQHGGNLPYERGQAQGHAAPAGKLDFLTRRPIDEECFPKLPEKPGIPSRLRDRWSEVFNSASGSAEEAITTRSITSGRRFRIMGLAAIAILILAVGLGLLALSAFSYIDVGIAPKEESINIDKIFQVAKSGGDLASEMMLFKQSAEGSKDTTGTLDANSRARGRIVIFNTYGAETQILVKRTRFETPSGKIFRTTEGVVVPGTTNKNGIITPGSIEVEAVADQPGEDYNIGLSDFTIPGFRGTARYTKFYGRSKTPMTGGSTSSQRVTAKSDVEELKIALAPELETEILSAYKSKIPEGFILLSDAYSITYGDAQAVPRVDAVGDKVTVSLAGDFKGLLIKEESLGHAIAVAYGKSDMAKKAHLANAKDLNIMVVKKDLDKGEMSVRVSGKARFVWNVDTESVKNDFLAKKPIVEIFGAYEGVEKAEVNFRPAWWHYVPKDGRRIDVKVVER